MRRGQKQKPRNNSHQRPKENQIETKKNIEEGNSEPTSRMDAAHKSYNVSNQVRHNAEDIKNMINDLYSWEKDMKRKEKQMQADKIQEDNKALNVPPVRSHTKETTSTTGVPTQLNDLSVCNGQHSSLDSPTEKRDTALDPLELKRKEANEVKDRGNRFVKLGDYTNAINEYTLAMTLDPHNAVYYTNRALCYLKLERYDECIEDCDRATEIDNLAVKAYYRRMQANESLGNNMDALKDCTTVLMIEPKNTEAKRSLERINERLRKNVKKNGPNFSCLRPNLVDILPIQKPAYKRSNKPLKRVAIADVVGPKESKNQENLKISDEDIDKLFNSSCGYFEEVKDPELIMKSKQKLELRNNQEDKSNINNTSAVNKNSNKMTNGDGNVKNTTTSDLSKLQHKTEKQKMADATADSNKLETHAARPESTEEIRKPERPLPAPPTSTAQFYSNWKELSRPQKYQYLKSIQISQLGRVLGAGFDSDTLTDVIRTLHDFYMPRKDAAMSATLLEISKNKQIPILSLLMSNEERKALSEIVNSLKENRCGEDESSTEAEQIMKNFNLN